MAKKVNYTYTVFSLHSLTLSTYTIQQFIGYRWINDS